MIDSTTSDDILIAIKRMMRSQLFFGLLVIIYQVFSGDIARIESASIGVVVAIIPGLFGMYLASVKAKKNPDAEIKDLIQFSRKVKLVYTVILFAIVFRLMDVENIVVIVSYCITFIGYFVSPFLNKKEDDLRIG
ncbi:ATP synthase subunit I [Vibrio marisflavi]|uniref:ATP synthase subunit I n=1 Tax=Vibrio marisflavi CECT 7928 TaxID=634439 RepID=A0ABM9A3S7_9VIBR|nr:ATP synthase subunit I [Vibrio marisflavi]CAH0539193.1 hypothetical protein VMF7928_01961 [Vibrio marisflavi CECT 7928]